MTFTYIPPGPQIRISVFLKFPVLKKPSHQPGIVIILSQTRIKFPKTWSTVERVLTVKLDRHQVMIRIRTRIKSIPKSIRHHASWGINSINRDILVLDLLCLVDSFFSGNLTLKTSQRDNESAKSLNSTEPLSPARASPPALSNSRLSIQLKSAPTNRGIPGRRVSISLKRTLICP